MTDQYPPPSDQHDTAAFARPGAAGVGDVPPGQQPLGASQWFVPVDAAGPGNPEADYWAARYRRQRTWTRFLAGAAVVGVLIAVGLGFTALQARTADTSAAGSPAASGDGGAPAPGTTAPDPTTPDGGTSPDGAPDTTPGTGSVPLDSLPLPDSLKSLGQTLGITDVSQLVQLAVANGMLSQEDADRLLSAIQGGAALRDLFGKGGSDDPGTQDAPAQGTPGSEL